ncbi:MAG: hypothetical protein ACRDXB_11615, partial [Actinomycetes bacterium]
MTSLSSAQMPNRIHVAGLVRSGHGSADGSGGHGGSHSDGGDNCSDGSCKARGPRSHGGSGSSGGTVNITNNWGSSPEKEKESGNGGFWKSFKSFFGGGSDRDDHKRDGDHKKDKGHDGYRHG